MIYNRCERSREKETSDLILFGQFSVGKSNLKGAEKMQPLIWMLFYP